MADAPSHVTPVQQHTSESTATPTHTSGRLSARTMLAGKPFDEQVQMLAPNPPTTTNAPATKDPVAPVDFAGALARWMPRLGKVCDPVAFMTSADAKGNTGKGNYARAIADKGAQAGFYEQAKAELGAIASEIGAFLGAASIAQAEHAELSDVVTLCGAYRDLYAALQNTGMSAEGAKNEALRAKVAARVRGALDVAKAAFTAVDGEIVGVQSIASIGRALDEIDLFVASWSDLSATSGATSASPYMWAAFLQTVERYRTILNQYGQLEGRGDATGTAKMAVKHGHGYAKTAGEMNAAAVDNGGTMGLALQSYSLKAESVAAYQKQVAAMVERVNAGEFESQADAVAAFRKTVGGGQASAAFYAQLDEVAKGAYAASKGEAFIAQEKQALDATRSSYTTADDATHASGRALDASLGAHDEHRAAADEMDKFAADEAWAACQTHKQSAEALLAKSQALLAQGDAHRREAEALHVQAMAQLASAKLALSKVDTQRYASLGPAVASIEGQIAGAETKLADNAETQARLSKYRAQIAARAQQQSAKLAAWDPAQVEVPAPTTEGYDVEGTLEHYQGFSIELSGRVPGAPYLELFGGVSGKGGKEREGDQVWSFVESEWKAGVKVDLWLFEVSIAYVGTVEFKVAGEVGALDVLERGKAEKSKWEASKEIGRKHYDKRIAAEFGHVLAQGQAAYGRLQARAGQVASAKGNDRARQRAGFDAEVEVASNEVYDLQSNLEGGIAAAFFDISGVFEMLRSASVVTDADVLYDDLQALKEVPDAGLVAATDASEQRFERDNASVGDTIVGRLSEAAGSSNDPNVTFEASGAWELSAGLAGTDFGVSRTATTTVSDGDGEQFDYSETDSVTWKATAPHVEVHCTESDDAWESGVAIEIDMPIPDKATEQQLVRAAIANMNLVMGQSAGLGTGALIDLIKSGAEGFAMDQLAKWSGFKNAVTSEHTVTIEGKIKKEREAGEWVWAGGSVAIGFEKKLAAKADVGVFAVEAEYVSGMRATFALSPPRAG